MTIAYRTAGPGDAPALAALGARCFAETFGHAFPPGDMALHLETMFGPEALATHYRDPALRIRMAEEDGAVAAYLKLAPVALDVPHEAGALEIKQLYVLAPWQGAGLAAALMDWAIGTGRTGGAPALYLSVWEQGGRAQAFYRKHGFETVGAAPFRVGARVYQDPVMRRGL